MDDKVIQVAIGSTRKKTSACSQTTTLQTPKDERVTQCGMSLAKSYGRNREHNKWRYDDLAGTANAGQRNVSTLVNG